MFGSFQVFWGVGSKQGKPPRFWQISKCSGVGSERKISLPRRLPKFPFPYYRSKRKFVAIPVQRVAGGSSFVSLAKRDKGRSQRAAKPLSGVILAKEKDSEQRVGTPVPFALCTEKPGQGQSAAYLEQFSTTVPKSAILRVLPLAGNLLGSAFPKPCFAPLRAKKLKTVFVIFQKVAQWEK